jgi:type VI secretion system protein ImpA
MNELVEKLLLPVSPKQPCGPDLSYDPRFDALEAVLKGKPEVEMGSVKKPAEPPDWAELRDKSAEFLRQSKHLRVATMMCCGLLKTGGLAGFLDGLQLVRGLLEQYWPKLYPLLDADDNNDPTQRLNILLSLTAPRGSVNSWLSFMDYLYNAPICQPKGAPPVTFDDILNSKRNKAGEGVPANTTESDRLAAAMRDAGSNPLAVHHETLRKTLETVQGIDLFLSTTLGAGNTINFEVLEKTLREMLAGLEPYLAGGGTDRGAESGAASAGKGSSGFAGVPVRGSIRSREDVVRAIDGICDYYRQVEPSSPVPYLLRRAQKLVKMDFVQAVQELNLATVESLRPSMGSAVGTGAGPGQTTT